MKRFIVFDHINPFPTSLKFFFRQNEGKTCPNGWKLHGTKCYEFFLTPQLTRNWDSARMYCESMNAVLVQVEDQQEQNYLSSFNRQLQSCKLAILRKKKLNLLHNSAVNLIGFPIILKIW